MKIELNWGQHFVGATSTEAAVRRCGVYIGFIFGSAWIGAHFHAFIPFIIPTPPPQAVNGIGRVSFGLFRVHF